MKGILKEEGWTVTKVAEGLGISRQALYKRLNGNMSAESLIEIFNVMGYDLYYGKDGKVKRF